MVSKLKQVIKQPKVDSVIKIREEDVAIIW